MEQTASESAHQQISLKKLGNGELKEVMASLVRKLYDLGVVVAIAQSFDF
jgi:hypothetical protein